VFAEDEADLLIHAAGEGRDLEAMIAERTSGLPLEQILGWAHFCGLRVAIEPGVFVPRQRTELLVREARALSSPGAIVVDLCCGSGAIGLAIKQESPGIRLFASDIEPAAVKCARRNVADSGQVFAGDLFVPLPAGLRGGVDILAVNAPYVPTDEIRFMPPEARDYEPLVTLDGGADGLDLHRRIAGAAPVWLRPGGAMLIETSRAQAEQTAAILERSGLAPRIVEDDELDATVVIGVKRPLG
jgi:release factor glutamine methyltransferase